MRIKSIDLTDYPPIGKFKIENLGSTIIIAGANGSGKTRLKQAIVQTIQGKPVMDMTIEATRPDEEEEKYFGSHEISVTKGVNNNKLKNYFRSRSFGRGRYVGSLVQIDSNRSVEKVNYSAVNWLGGDPDDQDTASNFYFSAFRARWQDFVNYIHQKTAARGKKISDAVISDPSKSGEEVIALHPNPLDKYKKIFREALPGKELLDIDPKSPRDFRYSDSSGQELNFQTLSSGEKEIIKVLFDVARKDIRHSIVIVDEPELHLHPTLTFQLVESLKNLGDQTNQFIFLTHSSDLITTYFSTGDVYFIDSENDGTNQAHRLLDLVEQHHEIVPLIGQNIGLFAVGKKIVFVEGEHSSIDRLAYQKIAQKVDSEIRVVPAGSVLNVFALSQIERQIRTAIYGIELYMIRDRDGLSDNQVSKLEENGRIHCLKRRHIENYFLDPEVLAAVAQRLYIDKRHPDVNRDGINQCIQEIVRESIGYTLYKTVCENLSMNYSIQTPKISDLHKKSLDDIRTELHKGVLNGVRGVADSLDDASVSSWLETEAMNLQRMVDDGTWVKGFHGKYIFNRVCSKVMREDAIRVRHAYVDIALEQYPNKISDILDIYNQM